MTAPTSGDKGGKSEAVQNEAPYWIGISQRRSKLSFSRNFFQDKQLVVVN